MDVEVLMKNDVKITKSSTEITETKIPGDVGADKIKNAREDIIIERALSAVDLPGDMT